MNARSARRTAKLSSTISTDGVWAAIENAAFSHKILDFASRVKTLCRLADTVRRFANRLCHAVVTASNQELLGWVNDVPRGASIWSSVRTGSKVFVAFWTTKFALRGRSDIRAL